MGKVTQCHLNKLAYVWQLSQHKMCVCENEAANDNYHQGSALKLRNTCCCSLTQRLVRWSCPVVHKAWVETHTRVAKGQKMGRTEAIQTGVVYFQHYHWLTVSVSSVQTWEKSWLLTSKTTLQLTAKSHSCNHNFFVFLRLNREVFIKLRFGSRSKMVRSR